MAACPAHDHICAQYCFLRRYEPERMLWLLAERAGVAAPPSRWSARYVPAEGTAVGRLAYCVGAPGQEFTSNASAIRAMRRDVDERGGAAAAAAAAPAPASPSPRKRKRAVRSRHFSSPPAPTAPAWAPPRSPFGLIEELYYGECAS